MLGFTDVLQGKVHDRFLTCKHNPSSINSQNFTIFGSSKLLKNVNFLVAVVISVEYPNVRNLTPGCWSVIGLR